MRVVISICWVSEVHHSELSVAPLRPDKSISRVPTRYTQHNKLSRHTSHVTRDMSHGDAPWEHSADPGQWDLGHCQSLVLTTQCPAALLPTSTALMQLTIAAGFVFYG